MIRLDTAVRLARLTGTVVAASLLLTLAQLPVAAPAHAADLAVMPVSVKLDRLRHRASVQVQNQGAQAVTMQVDAVSWTRSPSGDVHEVTDELIVNPPVFTVQAGQTQVLRLGLKGSTPADRERTYRLVLREVPTATAAEAHTLNGSVRVLVSVRLPVYVAPAVVERRERWELRAGAQGELLARATNAGNVHFKVGTLRLHDDRQRLLAESTAANVLLPGETRDFPLRALQDVPAGALRLEVLGDQGLQHVAVALDRR